MSGFFKVHRGWMDSTDFKPEPFTEREAFLWSIERAAHEDHDQWFNGERFHVDRGEFVTSLRAMEQAFGWSIKRIRGFMDRMVKCQKWTQQRARSGAQSPTIVSVVNYEKYQGRSEKSGTAKGTAKGTRGAQSGHSRGTQQKNGQEFKEEKCPSDTVLSLVLPDPVDLAFAAYEDLRRSIVPNARPADLSPDRRKKLSARLTEIGGLAAWQDVLAIVSASRFLRGETSRTGRLVATIDWLLKPENLRKVREGNYDERHPADDERAAFVSNSPIDALTHAIAAAGLAG